MDSVEMKTKVLSFFRFGGYSTRMTFVATEAGPFNADVLVSDGEKDIIEIETKISWADFKSDFKKRKHAYMKSSWQAYRKGMKPRRWLPTKFYFAVPKVLVPKAIEAVKGTPYGVLGVLRGQTTKKDNGDRWCRIFVRAKPINTVCPKLLHRLQLRASSELVCLRLTGLQEARSKGEL